MFNLSITDIIKGYTLAMTLLIYFAISSYDKYTIRFQAVGIATVINVLRNLFGHALVIVSILLANCDYRSYSKTFLLQLQDITTKTNNLYPQNFLDNLYKKLLSYFLIINTIGLSCLIVGTYCADLFYRWQIRFN